MSQAVAIAMFGWIPVAIALFLWLPPWRAALAGFLVAWLFLPNAVFVLKGLPDYTKFAATCGVVLLGVVLFDFRRLISLRPAWYDIPILLFCLSPFVSSLTNRLGVHDGFSAVFEKMLTWGVPYAIGRLYFDSLSRARELAIGILVSGFVYAPLCLYELWKGPELHRIVYGYYQPYVDTELRFGILRPMVFMQSGLMLAVWMAAATVLGVWLWKSRALPTWRGFSIGWFVPVLGLITILMRSVNGWVLLALGLGLMALCFVRPSKIYLVCVIAVLVGYIGIRAADLWSGNQAAAAAALISPARSSSILYRFRNEDIISGNARQKPLFGWGRQSAAISDGQGSFAVCDSLWMAMFVEFGVVGLVGFTGSLLFPIVLFIRSFPPAQWREAAVAPAAALAIVLILYTTDHLANGMINPVFMLVSGALTALSVNALRNDQPIGA